MQNLLYLCGAFYVTINKITRYIMETKKYLGVILILLGVLCLVVYKFAFQSNALLVISMVLEVAGILSYIFINKRTN